MSDKIYTLEYEVNGVRHRVAKTYPSREAARERAGSLMGINGLDYYLVEWKRGGEEGVPYAVVSPPPQPVSPTTYDPTIAAYDQPRVPTPEEEPDVGVRWWIACLIPAERLGRVPTTDEEPDAETRLRIARRIPANRLERVPTLNEEPDVGVRLRIALRIPAERLERLPTPEEEPDARVRRWIANRIKENTQ